MNDKESVGALCPIDLVQLVERPRRCEIGDPDPIAVDVNGMVREQQKVGLFRAEFERDKPSRTARGIDKPQSGPTRKAARRMDKDVAQLRRAVLEGAKVRATEEARRKLSR